MLNGHEHFKGWDWEKRISVLKRLINIFGKAEELGKIYVRMDVAKMLSPDVEGIAFMYLVERVELYLRERKEPGLLIGDRESDTVSGAFVESLSQYRNAGTRFHFGRQLTHLIDAVHFTSSHHSRMLQLADLHVWLRQLAATGSNGKWHRAQVLDHIGTIDGYLYANKVKIWPTNDAWLGVAQANP